MPIERTNPDDIFTPPDEAKYTQVLSTSGNKHVFVAGVISKNEKGEMVGVDDMETQVRTVLEQIELCLATEGATMGDVVRRRVFTIDIDRFLEVQGKVYEDFWTADESPGSTLVQVESLADPHHTGLAPGEPEDVEPRFLVEIDVTAVLDE